MRPATPRLRINSEDLIESNGGPPCLEISLNSNQIHKPQVQSIGGGGGVGASRQQQQQNSNVPLPPLIDDDFETIVASNSSDMSVL